MKNKREQTLPEEIANSAIHGIGTCLAVVALAVLVTLAGRSGDVWRIVSCVIYGTTIVLLFASSTLYHGFQAPRIKALFRVFDHSAIFLLIAGTYTPFTLVNLRGPWGWTMFGLIWSLALFGIVFTVFTIKRFHIIPVLIYLGMGWLMVIAVKPLIAAVSPMGLTLLAAGGLFYTLGVGFYLWKRLPFHHAIWHLFVMGGSACHFFAVLRAVLPMAAA